MAVVRGESVVKRLMVLCMCMGMMALSAAVDGGAHSRKLSALVKEEPLVLKYHNGPLLTTKAILNIHHIWYGKFTPAQRAIVADFVQSLGPMRNSNPGSPSVSTWWKTTEDYKGSAHSNTNANANPSLSLGKQKLDEGFSMGRSLKRSDIAVESEKLNKLSMPTEDNSRKNRELHRSKDQHATPAAVELDVQLNLQRQLSTIAALVKTGVESGALPASNGNGGAELYLVLTSEDVMVENFCRSSCGFHASASASGRAKGVPYVYARVGNSASQCQGQCAWPFHQPLYGPQTPPLLPPNGDVGIDGMVINIAASVAGAVTNPFNTGYFQGQSGVPLEAVSACPGMYGKGAYPGFPGQVLVDSTTGASYNAHGLNGRTFLLPAMWDPSSRCCKTLV